LHVAVAPVEVADREQRLGALAWRLADADEDARRERDGEAAGVLDRPQPHGRDLVGRTEVRTSAFRQPVDDVSSIMPIDALTCFSRASSS
jgi:hypothetical protein